MGRIAKVTSKGQTTIPIEIRKALAVGPGDLIAWEMLENGRATVHRVTSVDLAYLRALEGALSEWNSPEDDKAFHDL